jgi:hypothetical protein
MLKEDDAWLAQVEAQYPGIREDIRHFEEAQLPACSACGSADTAKVICGVIGRTMHIVGATTKAALIAKGPAAGAHFCNACRAFF